MPPLGADDQPNGAALIAMKDRLEAEGIRVAAGAWEVPEDAPVLAPAWQAEAGFEARALIAALGEAGVQPLTVAWRPPCGEPAQREALTSCSRASSMKRSGQTCGWRSRRGSPRGTWAASSAP